jgi:hypothetical protein
MSQHYIKPELVAVPDDTPAWPSPKQLKYIEADGLIVPILVFDTGIGGYVAADKFHGERVLACLELNFETILVETEWTEEDL